MRKSSTGPTNEKKKTTSSSKRVKINKKLPHNVCVLSDIGKRPTNEDTHAFANLNSVYFYAIYDGHGGKGVSAALKRDFASKMLQALKGINLTLTKNYKQVRSIMVKTVINYDNSLYKSSKNFNGTGSTATMVVRQHNTLYFINLGDSRSVLYNKKTGKIVFTTTDHKPTTISEHNRILRSGGYVSGKRVNGILALSRAFGDFNLKKNKQKQFMSEHGPVSSRPNITIVKLTQPSKNYRLILACDGLWDVFTNKQVVKMVGTKTINRSLCKSLINSAIQRGSTDNVSVMIVDT